MKRLLITILLFSSVQSRADFCSDLLKKTYKDILLTGHGIGQVAGMIKYIQQLPEVLESSGFSYSDRKAFEQGINLQIPMLEKALGEAEKAVEYKIEQFGNDLQYWAKNCR